MFGKRIVGVAVGALILSACGSSGDNDSNAITTNPVGGAAADETDVDDAGGAGGDIDDLVDDLEAAQDAIGGGGATFTANGQTWEFPSVLCAFGEDQIGQAGAVFNLSAIGDGLQLYASIDDDGATHRLSLNDIKDFENPSVALTMDPFFVDSVGAPSDFIVVDGKQVTSTVLMIDETTGTPIGAPAQLTATCP